MSSERMPVNGLFIDGRWAVSESDATIPVINPATEETLAIVSIADDTDVDHAIRAARAAFPAWSRLGGVERGQYLRKLAAHIRARGEELAALSSRNNGKPIAEARIDISDAIAAYEYYAGLAEDLDARQNSSVALPEPGFQAVTRFDAVGVAALIVPWNFPFVTTAWKLAPALAAGCTVVLKPSEITPLVELELGHLAKAIGLPSGVLNIVTGTGEVGSALVSHSNIDKVSFTGSTGVGEQVMASAARHITNLSLELGGKSPMLVFNDADVDQAVEWIIGGVFYNCGQMCSATSRLIVQQDIAPRLLEKLKAATEALTLGEAFIDGVNMGPLTSAKQLDTMLGYFNTARAEGLELLTGGHRASGFEQGYFVEPTIFVDVPTDSLLWREEIFGPVLCVHRFNTEEEAIALANDCEFGLAAGIITADKNRAARVAAALQAGHIWINSLQVVFPETSWGGFKRSGIGRELGPWGLDAYLEVKHIIQPNH